MFSVPHMASIMESNVRPGNRETGSGIFGGG
jgi:hypothetical protein